MHSPRTSYLNSINKILRYLKGTPEKKIWMKKMILTQYVVILTQIRRKGLIKKNNYRLLHLCR
jgi:predicted rRNA methylase YqxC with S4 and FtsJ domains